MRSLRKLRLRFQSVFNRSRVERDLEDELRDYLDSEIERAIAGGSSPEEAKRHALSSLNGADRLKEECRDARKVDDQITLGQRTLLAVGGPEHLVQVAERDLMAFDLQAERFAGVIQQQSGASHRPSQAPGRQWRGTGSGLFRRADGATRR